MIVRRNYITYYLVFTVILLVNLILRYPSEGIRGGGSDSWHYFTQANQIIRDGQILWLYNLLSIYGFYPPYQEMGTALIFASSSSVTGLSMPYSIFVVSLFLGLFSFLISILFFRELFNSDYVVLLMGLFFSCSPDISSSTSWVIHARYSLTIFSFFILFIMLKSYNNRINFKYVSLLLISLVVFGTIHRSSIWLLFLVIFYLLLNIFSKRIKQYNFLPSSYKLYLVNLYFCIAIFALLFSLPGNFTGKF